MSSAKRLKVSTSEDDDVIFIESSNLKTSNDFCHEIDETTRKRCEEFSFARCFHCHSDLCFEHLDRHRLVLLNQRDQLIDQFNECVDLFHQWKIHPDRFRTILLEIYQKKFQRKLSFLQRLELENLIDFNQLFEQLEKLFQPVKILLARQQCVSAIQIEKLRTSLSQFDQKRTSLFDQVVDTFPVNPNSSMRLFHWSNLDLPSRQIPLLDQRSSCHEMAASGETLLINARDHLLLFNFDQTSSPEEIEWKFHRDGKILDLHFNSFSQTFFLLSEEKFFSFDRSSSSFVSLLRLTSKIWSFTIVIDSIYFLHKSSLLIEQWKFDRSTKSIQWEKQWKAEEILHDDQHDQHFRCIRTNSSENQLAILIENDECRWRVALFDTQMNFLSQTQSLENASTIDWNLVFSFINDRQMIVFDGTTSNSYLITIDDEKFLIECKTSSDLDVPVNACPMTHNGCHQLIVKTVRPNLLKFCQC